MKRALDTDVGVQDFKIGERMRDDNPCKSGDGWRYGRSTGDCNARSSHDTKLCLGRRIGFDKVPQPNRVAVALRRDGLLARMLTTTVRGSVGCKAERKLGAAKTVTPNQCTQQQESQERIGKGPHSKLEYSMICLIPPISHVPFVHCMIPSTFSPRGWRTLNPWPKP
jgi:hypothetical protein